MTGIIRGTHVAPGVYTKYTPIRTDVVNTDLQYQNTQNMVVVSGKGGVPFTVYFGYYPLKSCDGTFTEDIIKQIEKIPLKDIIKYEGIKRIDTTGGVSELPLTQHKNAVIPVAVKEDELRRRIASGDKYNKIADANNNCVILAVPRYKYDKDGFDIVDEKIDFSIYDKFNYIMTKSINDTTYKVFVMFNNTFAYSRIGVDKAIAPVKLIWK